MRWFKEENIRRGCSNRVVPDDVRVLRVQGMHLSGCKRLGSNSGVHSASGEIRSF